MPYNTTPIRPRNEVTGQVQLPCKKYPRSTVGAHLLLRQLSTSNHNDEAHANTMPQVSRVKKIIAVDPDINICSNNAAFAITLATVGPHHFRSETSQLTKFVSLKPRSCSSSIWQNKAITWPSWIGNRGGTSNTRTCVSFVAFEILQETMSMSGMAGLTHKTKHIQPLLSTTRTT